MFTKILVANRGAIAVRILRTCREMGINTVAVYAQAEQGSVHVRLADEAYALPDGYADAPALLAIAHQAGVDAIHPGYGFLAEDSAFARACGEQGITLIGPTPECQARARDKIGAAELVRNAGIATTRQSPRAYRPDEYDELASAAAQIGFPLVAKSVISGRGRGTRVIRNADDLREGVEAAQAAARVLVGDQRIYLEAAVLPSHYITVPLLGDSHGNLIHLGERDGSLQRNNHKLLEETPAPGLTDAQRHAIWETAITIGKLFGLQSAGIVEFVVDGNGQASFTEMKARLQVEHVATEMRTRIDMVREQILIAAGQPLSYTQDEIALAGVAIQCQLNAEDPWNHFLPSPGRLDLFRLPGGPQVRVDTYVDAGAEVPVEYDALLAKICVWGATRDQAIARMQRALHELVVRGVQTNLPLLQRIITDDAFVSGSYTTEFGRRKLLEPMLNGTQADLAAIAAVAALLRNQHARPISPDYVNSGWHRSSRQI